MARYIDADKVKKYLHEDDFGTPDERWKPESEFAKMIDATPTADVQEVKHGRWIEDGYYEEPCVCSICGEKAKYISTFEERFDYDWEENLRPTGYEEIREYIRTPYCPNCGAKMNGEA